ncbi:MAG: alkaline phosphatase family protein [bacterium]|nr:alkaline phosphatase family protein [bacterium]
MRHAFAVLIVLAFGIGCADRAHQTPGQQDSGSTAEQGPTISRIAFGSCAFQWTEQTIFRSIVSAEPDLYLSLGDAIYGDFDGKAVFDVTPDSLRAEWNKLGQSPDWQHLVANVPVMATWDNHDCGHHSAGAEFELKEVSKEIFLDFYGEPADSKRRTTPGIYTARTFGPPGQAVQVILLDTRYFKCPAVLADRPEGARGSLGKYAPNSDPEASLLGEAQWSWLEEQLRQPADLRLVASSTQIVADQKGMDEWGNYPLERRRLFDLIETTGAEGVILLSGNVHFAEISETDEGPYPLIDFTSSGLTHVNQEYPKAPNPCRVAGPYVDLNFGMIEIDWNAEPETLVTLKAVGIDGVSALKHRISLDSLKADGGTS